MPSSRVSALSREDILAAARRIGTSRPAKWTTIVEERELPVRPLVLEAAGVPPNDSTNSHQAVKILKDLGFPVRYQGKPNLGEEEVDQVQPGMDELIRSLRGRYAGTPLMDDREREHRIEKSRFPE